jgi:threonine synthase
VLTAHPAKFEDAVREAIGIDPPSLPVVEALRAVPISEHRFTALARTPGWKDEWARQLKMDVAASDAAVARVGSGARGGKSRKARL